MADDAVDRRPDAEDRAHHGIQDRNLPCRIARPPHRGAAAQRVRHRPQTIGERPAERAAPGAVALAPVEPAEILQLDADRREVEGAPAIGQVHPPVAHMQRDLVGAHHLHDGAVPPDGEMRGDIEIVGTGQRGDIARLRAAAIVDDEDARRGGKRPAGIMGLDEAKRRRAGIRPRTAAVHREAVVVDTKHWGSPVG